MGTRKYAAFVFTGKTVERKYIIYLKAKLGGLTRPEITKVFETGSVIRASDIFIKAFSSSNLALASSC